VRSVAKLPNIMVSGGQLLNQKLSPSLLSTDEGLEKMIDVVRGFFGLKGWHIQFNVVSADTLRDAMNNPSKYRDLIVRVAGYSARFVDLDPKVQRDIISRTEQAGF
jgi:formate C-acetyltransferase